MQVSDVMLSVGTKWRCTPCFLWIALKCGVVMFQPYFFFSTFPPPCTPFSTWVVTFSIVGTIHFNHILLYLTLQQYTCTYTHSSFCAAKPQCCCFASSAEANNSLTVLSLNAAERGRGMKVKREGREGGRQGERERLKAERWMRQWKEARAGEGKRQWMPEL